jgi:hypothetical protein
MHCRSPAAVAYGVHWLAQQQQQVLVRMWR